MSLPLVFEWVLRSSAMAGILVVFILLVKLLIKDKLGARWHYWVWFLVLLRLFIPVAPESSLSIFNLFTSLAPQGNTTVIVGSQYPQHPGTAYPEVETGVSEQLPQSNISVPESENTPVGAAPVQTDEPSAPTGRSVFSILALIWLAGLTILALYTFTVNFLFWLKIRGKGSIIDERVIDLFNQCKEEMGVYQNVPLIASSSIKTTTLFGLFRPRLLLPPGIVNRLSPDELRCIFFHELAHIKQKDILINWLVGLARIIHWFNPVIWYAFHRMKQDREVACDALALSYLNPEEYKQYGRVMISLLESFAKTARVPGMIGVVGDSNSNLKKRIRMIALFKKNSYKLSAVAVLLIIVFSVVFLTNASGNPVTGLDPAPEKPEEVRGNTVGNIANGGLVAYSEGWIYYSNPEDDGRLYKKKTDGSGVTRLSDNGAMYINVVGDWIYYSTSWRPLIFHHLSAGIGGNIYKIRTDGSAETALNDQPSAFVQVVDDWIYYTGYDLENEQAAIYKMSTDGSGQNEIISIDGRHLTVVDGWAYFSVIDWENYYSVSDSEGIYKVRVDGSGHERITSAKASSINVVGDWIYYTGLNGEAIFRIRIDGAEQRRLSDANAYFINVEDDWIYYVNHGDDWRNIYRMRTDGSEKARLSDQRAFPHIFTAGEWLYYATGGLSQFSKIEKDAPAQTGLRPREEVSEAAVKEEIWQRATDVLGEAPSRGPAADGPWSYEGPAFSGFSWLDYDKYTAYGQMTYRMPLESNEMEQVIDQVVREFSSLFAELATMPDIDNLIQELLVETVVHDTSGVWRVGINIRVDGETLINADWSNPVAEIVGGINEFSTFTEWWAVGSEYNEGRVLPISVHEENGIAKFIVEF